MFAAILALLALALTGALALVFQKLSRLDRRLRDLEGRPVGASDITTAGEMPPQPAPEAPQDAEWSEEDGDDEPDSAPEESIGDFTPPPEEQAARAAAAAPAPAASPSLEEALGARWTVWLGGLALALGAVFLVRYSIESGLLGPGVRVLLGALLALVLLAGGEFTRRRDLTSPVPGLQAAHIPAMLTAVGSLAGFATIYAAYALYGFLDPLIAFILLAVVSLASLAGALLHGPALAALGLAGSYVTPALVASDHPSAWMLFVYLMFVTGSAYALADARRWLWLAISATAGAVAWALMWLAGPWAPGDNPVLAIYMAVLIALALFFLRDDSEDDETEEQISPRPDWIAAGIVAAVGFLALPLLRLNDHDLFSLSLLAATMAALIGSAWRWPRLVLLAPWAAALFSLGYVSWHIPALMNPGSYDAFTDFARPGPAALQHFLTIGASFAGALIASGAAASLSGRLQPAWAGMAVVAPLVTFIYAYFRAVRFEQSPPFAIAALVMAALFAVITEWVQSRNPPGKDPATGIPVAIYAAGAVAWVALGLTIQLEKGWLTVALALLAPALAWISLKRPYWVFRPLVLVLAATVTARLVLDPLFAGHNVGTTPIFNWLLYGYGVPAAAFAAAAWMFVKQRDGLTVRVLEGAAIAYTAVLASLQIRHLMNGGDVVSSTFDLAEMSIHSLTWLGLSIGLHRFHRRTNRVVARYGSTVLGFAGLGAIALGHLVVFNPAITRESIGTGLLFNDLLLGYAVPAVLCLVLARAMKEAPDKTWASTFGRIARVLALVLVFAYLTLEVMALYQGPRLAESVASDAELYTYSAVWLAYGIALLAGGIVLANAPLRYASFAVIMLTVLKVFLVDMSALTGALRALSFLALGLVLIGIGTVYQKLVFPRHTTAGKPDDGPGGDPDGSPDPAP